MGLTEKRSVFVNVLCVDSVSSQNVRIPFLIFHYNKKRSILLSKRINEEASHDEICITTE